MSCTTSKLLGIRPRLNSPWRVGLKWIAMRLVAEHGVPTLGNFRDPVREIFYILLSARTTDSQYRRTFLNLRRAFPTLLELANAPIPSIRSCILSGGLAGKRARQIRLAAKALVAIGGKSPSRFLKALNVVSAYRTIINLPGMGPKSTLCVLMYSLDFDVFPVDINVQRIAERIGAIPKGMSHPQAQRRLAAIAPDGSCRELHIAMVVHGRKICLPVRPKCGECNIRSLCRTGRTYDEDVRNGGCTTT